MVLEQQDSTCKKINLDPDLQPSQKMKSKQIINLNLKPLEDDVGEKPDDFGLGDDFFETMPRR